MKESSHLKVLLLATLFIWGVSAPLFYFVIWLLDQDRERGLLAYGLFCSLMTLAYAKYLYDHARSLK